MDMSTKILRCHGPNEIENVAGIFCKAGLSLIHYVVVANDDVTAADISLNIDAAALLPGFLFRRGFFLDWGGVTP